MKRIAGRPPLDQRSPSAAVHLKVPTVDLDKADRIARGNNESVQDVIRRGLKNILRHERDA